MTQTSRDLVKRALRFETPERIPRQLWALPWAREHHPDTLAGVERDFPSDFSGPASPYAPSSRAKGNAYELGEYIDEWGCVFDNIQRGVIGEVKQPLLNDLADWHSVKAPYEMLAFDSAQARARIAKEC